MDETSLEGIATGFRTDIAMDSPPLDQRRGAASKGIRGFFRVLRFDSDGFQRFPAGFDPCRKNLDIALRASWDVAGEDAVWIAQRFDFAPHMRRERGGAERD